MSKSKRKPVATDKANNLQRPCSALRPTILAPLAYEHGREVARKSHGGFNGYDLKWNQLPIHHQKGFLAMTRFIIKRASVPNNADDFSRADKFQPLEKDHAQTSNH